MTKSNNFLTFALTVLILLFELDVSLAQRTSAEIVKKSETSDLHSRAIESVNDLLKEHPRKYVEQLTRTTVDGRLQYVLGARIAGKTHIGEHFQLN